MIDLTAVPSQQQFIGAIIKYGFTPQTLEAIEMLDKGMFSEELYRRAYVEIERCARAGDVFDVYALHVEGKFSAPEAGNLIGLAEYSVNSNVLAHARNLIQSKNIRAILNMGQQVNDLVANGNSYSQIMEAVRDTMAMIETDDTPSKTVTLSEAILDYPDALEDRMTFSGLSWGSDEMDKAGGRMRGGQVCILAGPPGTGKSEQAMRITRHVAFEQGKGVVIFSAEMSREELADRFVAIEGDIPGGYLEHPALMNHEDCEHLWGKVSPAIAACQDKGAEVFIHDEANIPYSRIVTVTKKCLAKTKNIGLIVIDYVQLIRDPSTKNRFDEVSEVSRQIKSIAKEFNLPVLLLAQLSREAVKQLKQREPENSDLRESAQLEQDADKICFLWAPDKDEPGSPNQDLVQAIFRKRRAGPPGRATFQFKNGHFYETEREWASANPKPSSNHDHGEGFARAR